MRFYMDFLDHRTPRLFLDAPLKKGAKVNAAPEQAHYLKHVMRLQTGENIRIFNGLDGEWRAAITAGDSGKKNKHAVTLDHCA